MHLLVRQVQLRGKNKMTKIEALDIALDSIARVKVETTNKETKEVLHQAYEIIYKMLLNEDEKL
jgi:predicted nucleic acid-binding Zn finger protein